mgnify:CR=1 FL=1
MTKEELKRQLNSYRNLKAECEQIAGLLAEIESRMGSPKSTGSDGLPKCSGSGDPMLGIVSEHIGLQDKYKALQDKLTVAQLQIEELIDHLDPLKRRLIRCHYIEGMTWEQVCIRINYGWAQTHRLHSHALNSILDQYNKQDGIE